jgi:hypothetical protein
MQLVPVDAFFHAASNGDVCFSARVDLNDLFNAEAREIQFYKLYRFCLHAFDASHTRPNFRDYLQVIANDVT